MNLVSRSHPALWRAASDVTDFSVIGGRTGLATRMIALAIQHGGIGLAAPQVGLSMRFFVARFGNEWLTCCNPVIAWRSRHTASGSEGCLSFPGQLINVKRHKAIDLTYRDESGREMRRHLTGMDAIVAQHEIAHLDGVCLFKRPTS